jgi:hypothetical protein
MNLSNPSTHRKPIELCEWECKEKSYIGKGKSSQLQDVEQQDSGLGVAIDKESMSWSRGQEDRERNLATL